MKVLIVEDRTIKRNLITSYLKEHGIESVHAKNGYEAIELLKHDIDFGCILMNYYMPIMNGIEACRLIKNNDDTKSIPIIMNSALDDSESQISYYENGADDFISIPIEDRLLLPKVKNCLKLSQLKRKNQYLIKKIKNVS